LRADRAEHRNGDRFRNGGDRKENDRQETDGRLHLVQVIAALIALVSFPAVIRLLIRAESTIDGATLLAAYHTAYNIVVVLVLMPVIGLFTRFVERLLPDRTSPLTRRSNPAALTVPIATVEGVRRTVARTVGSICGSVDAA
jgi:phosphate:Na+ symporter